MAGLRDERDAVLEQQAFRFLLRGLRSLDAHGREPVEHGLPTRADMPRIARELVVAAGNTVIGLEQLRFRGRVGARCRGDSRHDPSYWNGRRILISATSANRAYVE